MDDIEKRRQIKAAMPHISLTERHTQNCRIIPNRNLLLERLPQNGIAAEIGVASGEYTRQILARNKPTRLHLIDSWGSSRYENGFEAIQQKFRREIDEKVVIINRGLSTERLQEFEDDYFDWVYIDTDHSYTTTSKELTLAAAKVKRNGRIAGHDFCTGNVIKPVVYGVIEACNEFCASHDWEYEYIAFDPWGHHSFVLRKMEMNA